MASRDLHDLHPDLQAKYAVFANQCHIDPWMLRNGIVVILTCTYRSGHEQDELYAQGRTKPGRVVTNAQAGESLHNFETGAGKPAARAFDVLPLRHGKPVWGTSGDGIDDDESDDHTDDLEVWQRVGAHGEAAGLEWAGRWKKFKEFPHFQMKGN